MSPTMINSQIGKELLKGFILEGTVFSDSDTFLPRVNIVMLLSLILISLRSL